MGNLLGSFKLSQLIVNFGLRTSEADAKCSIRNGVVAVNGKIENNPEKEISLVTLNELKCGKHLIVLNRSN